MLNSTFRLLFINVYMSYEGDDDITADFADQLTEVESLINSNSDCHVIVGGYFNVDFSRDRLHTAILTSFCDNMGLNPVVHHSNCSTDYTYNFNMCRLSILYHLLWSGTIFNRSVGRAYVIHDIDNPSDHEPIALQLLLEAKHIGFCDRIHTSHVSWVKASESDLCNYRCELTHRLRCIKTTYWRSPMHGFAM